MGKTSKKVLTVGNRVFARAIDGSRIVVGALEGFSEATAQVNTAAGVVVDARAEDLASCPTTSDDSLWTTYLKPVGEVPLAMRTRAPFYV